MQHSWNHFFHLFIFIPFFKLLISWSFSSCRNSRNEISSLKDLYQLVNFSVLKIIPHGWFSNVILKSPNIVWENSQNSRSHKTLRNPFKILEINPDICQLLHRDEVFYCVQSCNSLLLSHINIQEKTNHLTDNPILLKVSNTIVLRDEICYFQWSLLFV